MRNVEWNVERNVERTETYKINLLELTAMNTCRYLGDNNPRVLALAFFNTFDGELRALNAAGVFGFR